MNDEKPKEYSYTSDNETREHLLNLIRWLYAEVCSAGGDGDAIWYSKHYWVNDIFEIAKDFNDTLDFKWNISLDAENKRINWYYDQSEILITNNQKDFDSRPDWQQCSIIL